MAFKEADETPALFARLKTVSLVVKHSQSAEALVKTYESKLYEEDAMNPDVKSIESAISTLKVRKYSSVFHQPGVLNNAARSGHLFFSVTAAMAGGDRRQAGGVPRHGGRAAEGALDQRAHVQGA